MKIEEVPELPGVSGVPLPPSSSAQHSDGEVERIVAAAVRFPVAQRFRGVIWNGERSYPDHLVVTAPPPARHHTLLHPLHHVVSTTAAFEDQGFITSTGRYVEREEALKIALASGQPMIDHPGRHKRWLFSEDLW